MVNVGVKLRDKERNRGTFMALKKKPVTGMKDILPAEMQIRDYVLNQIKETYRGFGFSAIETPCVEHIENLLSKQGGDNEKLIFKILKRGEKLNIETAETENDLADGGLRYDLTGTGHLETLGLKTKCIYVCNIVADDVQFVLMRPKT